MCVYAFKKIVSVPVSVLSKTKVINITIIVVWRVVSVLFWCIEIPDYVTVLLCCKTRLKNTPKPLHNKRLEGS